MTDPVETGVHRCMLDAAAALEIPDPDVDDYHRRAGRILARRSRATVVFVVVAVVAVVSLAADVTVQLSTRSSGVHPGVSRSATTAGPSETLTAGRVAEAEVKAALDAMKIPPGAQRLTTSPSDLLVPSSVLPATGHVAEEVRWWTVKGRLSDVLAFVQANPPAGLHPVQGAIGNTGAQLLDYDSVPPGKVLRVIIHLAAVQIGDEVGLEIDASELWGAT